MQHTDIFERKKILNVQDQFGQGIVLISIGHTLSLSHTHTRTRTHTHTHTHIGQKEAIPR